MAEKNRPQSVWFFFKLTKTCSTLCRGTCLTIPSYTDPAESIAAAISERGKNFVKEGTSHPIHLESDNSKEFKIQKIMKATWYKVTVVCNS